MELTPEHSQRLDSMLAQARKGVVDDDLVASVLADFGESEAAVIDQILEILQGSRFGHAESVLDQAPRAISQLSGMGPETARALWVAFNALGVAHLRIHQYLSAHHWYEQALQVANECHLRGEAQASLVNSGLAYRGLGDAGSAVAELYRVAIDDRSLLANRGPANLFLAHVYADQADGDRELVHLRRSIESDGPVEVLEARSMLAKALTRRGLVSEARRVLDESNLECLGDNTPFHWAYYLSANGDTLAAEGRTGEALLCLASAQAKLENSISDIPAVMVGLSTVRVCLLAKQTGRGLRVLRSMNQETMCIADARDYLSLLIVACTRLGHVGDALRAAADRVRLVDNRLADPAALMSVRRRVEREVSHALETAPTEFHDSAGTHRTSRSVLARMVQGAVDDVGASAAKRGVYLSVIDRAPGVMLAVKPDVLRGSLDALLLNAVRFNRRGGFVEVQLLDLGQTVRVRILSTGVGWAPDARPAELDIDVCQAAAASSQLHDEQPDFTRPDFTQPNLKQPNQKQSSLEGSILAASEAGCSITGVSPGGGSGAVFILEIPVASPTKDVLDLRSD